MWEACVHLEITCVRVCVTAASSCHNGTVCSLYETIISSGVMTRLLTGSLRESPVVRNFGFARGQGGWRVKSRETTWFWMEWLQQKVQPSSHMRCVWLNWGCMLVPAVPHYSTKPLVSMENLNEVLMRKWYCPGAWTELIWFVILSTARFFLMES